MEYKKRIADQILADKLEASGAVLIEGPKYCGKTTLAKQQAGSILSMADPDTLSQNLALAKTNITRLLAGDTPRLIDEWQIAPQFWDAVRNEVDKREDPTLRSRMHRKYIVLTMESDNPVRQTITYKNASLLAKSVAVVAVVAVNFIATAKVQHGYKPYNVYFTV